MKISLILFLIIFVLSPVSFAASVESVNINSKGVDLLIETIERHEEAQKRAKKEAPKGQPPAEVKINPNDFNPAFEKFISAIGSEPSVAQYRFNLALVLQLQGKLIQALKEYEFLLKVVPDTNFKFDVYFNKAILHAQAGDIELALNSYQQALSIKPGDKEVKTNIELLWQQQQGKGKGKGKEKDKNKKKKEDQDEDGNKDPNPEGDSDEEERKKRKKPKPLSEKEIKRILEELKNQEKKIRAKDIKGKVKESPREKDW